MMASGGGLIAALAVWMRDTLKIKHRFHDQHLDSSSIDWTMLQKVERDICLLYHQLADYSYIMGDLSYGSVFNLPYWEFLSLDGIDSTDRDFIRDGCLVMILAMAWDQIDGSGSYINSHIADCRAALERLDPADEKSARLLSAVKMALDEAEHRGGEAEALGKLSAWVHEAYVQGYFRGTVEEFERNRYYSGEVSQGGDS